MKVTTVVGLFFLAWVQSIGQRSTRERDGRGNKSRLEREME